MTDVSAQPAAADPTPGSITDFDGGTNADFDRNLDEFLGRDLFAEAAPEPINPEPAPAAPVNPEPAAPNGGQTPPATSEQPQAPVNPAPQGGDPAAPQAPQGVDPSLLLEMMTGQPTAPVAPAAPTPAPANAAPAPAPAANMDDIPQPFTMDLQLPAGLAAALFESEDPVQRNRALTGLIASIGNASVHFMEQRIREYYQPRFAAQATEATQAATVARQSHDEFYGEHADLAGYKTLVQKAGTIIYQHNPNAKWDADTRRQIADLTRGTLKQMGIQLGAPAPAAQTQPASQTAPQPAAPAAPRTPYVAGGARPAGFMDTPADHVSPDSILDLGDW